MNKRYRPFIEFKKDSVICFFDPLDFKEQHESIIERRIDLVEKRGLINPYSRKSILDSAR